VNRVQAFGRFAYDFVIGDDWRLAAAALGALVLAGIVAHNGGSAWWIVPLVVAVLLGVSVLRAPKRT
jgi:hypothetical protein